MLKAEAEMFGKLAAVVETVKNEGDWRGSESSQSDVEAVETWLQENWIDGFHDDGALVEMWSGATQGDLRSAVEEEMALTSQLLDIATETEAGLKLPLSKRTLQSWIKDLGDQREADQQIVKNL